MSIRKQFAAEFGEKEAARIEAAAIEHGNGINNKNIGSDPFKWALLICIGYECFSRDRFRKYHGIKAKAVNIKKWIKKQGHLELHNGDCDYLSLLSGAYNEYMPKK